MDEESIVVAGAGNTGSHLLPHLARMPQVRRIAIIDPDHYTSQNSLAQNIDASDAGKPKAFVQARKLRRINANLTVEPIVARIEDVPLAIFSCSALVSCVDSRAGRQWANEIAWRSYVPLIDCGVLASQNLARVTVYLPSPTACCLECGWGTEQYAELEQEYPCSPAGSNRASGRPTGASSALGALAASLTAVAVDEVLAKRSSVAGYEVVVDARYHKMLVTTNRRNPVCRFDHRKWVIDRWECDPRSTSVQSAIETRGLFSVMGHRFVSRLVCPSCGAVDQGLKLNRPVKTCASCGVRMAANHCDTFATIDADLAQEYRALTLAQIGLRTGDVLTCGDRHFALSEAR